MTLHMQAHPHMHTHTYIGILGEDLGILASILKGGTDKNYR